MLFIVTMFLLSCSQGNYSVENYYFRAQYSIDSNSYNKSILLYFAKSHKQFLCIDTINKKKYYVFIGDSVEQASNLPVKPDSIFEMTEKGYKVFCWRFIPDKNNYEYIDCIIKDHRIYKINAFLWRQDYPSHIYKSKRKFGHQ